jgi:hypothetical protein
MPSPLIHGAFSAFDRLAEQSCGTMARAAMALSCKVAAYRATSVKTLDGLLLAVSGGVSARKS